MNDLFKLDRSALFVLAGPCVMESADLCLTVARHLKDVCQRLGLPYVFKASFDKANRSSVSGYRGPGLEAGLAILERVKREVGVPVLTDVHEAQQATAVGRVVDVIQIPAFLARQTDLLVAAAKTGRVVNVKKGQFMSPQEMGNAVEKVRSCGNQKVMLTERGTFFGYSRLVNDFTGIAVMKGFGCPVVFDVTHSTQQPGGLGNASGGNPKYAPMLARAAVAAGVDGLFIECHPEPAKAKSDAASMIALDTVETLLRQVKQLAELRRTWEA